MAKTPAARIDMVVDLFLSGNLCDCSEIDEVFDEDRNVIGTEIRHKKTCVGRLKARELLTDESLDEEI